MLEVAVIGAGTSGLVAARHLIHAGLRPTIFEAAKTIGGAWTPPPSVHRLIMAIPQTKCGMVCTQICLNIHVDFQIGPGLLMQILFLQLMKCMII